MLCVNNVYKMDFCESRLAEKLCGYFGGDVAKEAVDGMLIEAIRIPLSGGICLKCYVVENDLWEVEKIRCGERQFCWRVGSRDLLGFLSGLLVTEMGHNVRAALKKG